MGDESSTLDPSAISFGEKRLPAIGSGPSCPEGGAATSQSTNGDLPSRLSAKLRNSISVWGFADQGIVSVASFAAAAIVGRTCTPAELGIYTLAVKIFWLAAGIPNALIWMPYTSRAPRMPEARRKFYLGSTSIHLAVLATAFCLALLTIGSIPLLGLSDKAWLFPMCLALIPFSLFMLLREHLRRVLIASMETISLLSVDVPIAVCQLAILAVLASTQQLSATSALVGMAFGCSWAVLWLARNHHRMSFQKTRIAAHWGHNFQFGRWLLVVAVAWFIGEASYFWLVEGFHGLDVMGKFSAAAITVTFFNPILLTLQNLARSILSNDFAEGGEQLLWSKTLQGTQVVALGFGVLFIALALVGGALVQLIFGEQFAGLDWIVASLCLGMYFHVLCTPVEAALTALQDGRTMLNAALLRLAVILAAGVPLIAIYGPLGVGFAMAAGTFSAGVLQWKHFHRRCSLA